jgi:hypothetical protein
MSHLGRLCALGAAAALTLTGLTVAGSPAQAAGDDPRPVSIGADWLTGQLTNGLLHYPDTGFGAYDDYGLSIDAGLSLDAIGGHDSTVAAIADGVAPHVTTSYAQSDEYAFTPPFDFVQHGYYAGPTAKALVFAQVAGEDTATWAGTDLVDAVEDRVTSAGASAGRIADDSSYGDFANVIGQAFATRGLKLAPSATKEPAVESFLLKQQCDAGYFRLNFTSDASATDQTCQGGVAGGDSAPDTDVTALTVLQLLAIPAADRSQAVTDAIDAAEGWLLASQRADGSFGGGASTEAANANSTGVAGWALGELGDTAAAAKAATWVRAHQADEPTACADALSGQTGAIGYDDAAVAAGRTDGITTATQDQWRRSTAPILPALRWAPASASALDVTGPTGYLRGGSSATYQVSGAAPGSVLCVSGTGSPTRLVASGAGSASASVTMPAATATAVVTASVRAGSSASVRVDVLGPTTLTVKPRRHVVHRRARLHVVVRGLAPAEQVTVRFRGRTVGTGVASPSGRFVDDVKVGRKLGKAKIKVRGEFGSVRRGKAVVRVVR